MRQKSSLRNERQEFSGPHSALWLTDFAKTDNQESIAKEQSNITRLDLLRLIRTGGVKSTRVDWLPPGPREPVQPHYGLMSIPAAMMKRKISVDTIIVTMRSILRSKYKETNENTTTINKNAAAEQIP